MAERPLAACVRVSQWIKNANENSMNTVRELTPHRIIIIIISANSLLLAVDSGSALLPAAPNFSSSLHSNLLHANRRHAFYLHAFYSLPPICFTEQRTSTTKMGYWNWSVWLRRIFLMRGEIVVVCEWRLCIEHWNVLMVSVVFAFLFLAFAKTLSAPLMD